MKFQIKLIYNLIVKLQFKIILIKSLMKIFKHKDKITFFINKLSIHKVNHKNLSN
jgi:hypothetical protein